MGDPNGETRVDLGGIPGNAVGQIMPGSMEQRFVPGVLYRLQESQGVLRAFLYGTAVHAAVGRQKAFAIVGYRICDRIAREESRRPGGFFDGLFGIDGGREKVSPDEYPGL